MIKTVPKNTQTGKEKKTFVVIKQRRTIWSTHFQPRSHYTEIEREKKTKTKSRAEYSSSKICYGGEDVKTDVTSQFFFSHISHEFYLKNFSAKDSTMIFFVASMFFIFLIYFKCCCYFDYIRALLHSDRTFFFSHSVFFCAPHSWEVNIFSDCAYKLSKRSNNSADRWILFVLFILLVRFAF